MNLLELVFGKSAPAIDALELNEKLRNGKHPMVLDVRQPEEYRTGHIPGAKLISLGELSQRMKELPKDKEIICVCASGNRSGSAVRMLSGAGFNAINMQGGMFSWRRASLQVKKGDAA